MKSAKTVYKKAQEKRRRVRHHRAMTAALASAIRISIDPNRYSLIRKKALKAIPYFKDQIAKTEKLIQ